MKKRQQVRKTLIMISFLFFPLTIYYLSPVLIIMGAVEGIGAGSFIAFALMFLFSLILGRLFCGWICPGGGLQEACMIINSKTVCSRKADLIKYLIWAPWLALIVVMFVRAGGISEIDPFYHMPGGISVAQPGDFVIYYFFVGLIVLLSLTAGKRAFCHYICWMAPFMIIGTRLKSLNIWPSLRLRATPDDCTDCNNCNKVCPMSLDVNLLIKSGIEDTNECILCGSCVDSCPRELIKFSFSRRHNR